MSTRILFLPPRALPFKPPNFSHPRHATHPLICKMPLPRQKAPPKRKSLKISHVTISYLTTAPAPSPTATATPQVLCLHGFGASSLSFVPLMHSLPTHNLLAYDAPGFGFTSRPSALTFYTPRFSASIATTLQSSTDSAALAHSMGALAAATIRPRKLILIAPALLPRTLSPSLGRLLRPLGAAFAMTAALLVTLLTPALAGLLSLSLRGDAVWSRALASVRHPSNPPIQKTIDDYRAPMREHRWQKGLLKFTVAALLDRARGLSEVEDFVDALRHSSCDVLIIHGADDPVVPLDNSVRLAERLDARLVVLDRCGHVPHEEMPDVVAGHVKQFLGPNFERAS